MTPLANIMSGLAARFATVPGLTVVQRIPEAFNFPSLLIVPPTTQIPDMTNDLGDSTIVWQFESYLLVGAAAEEDVGQLIPFQDPASTQSLWNAVHDDITLGGLNVVARFQGFPRLLTFDEIAKYRAYGMVVLTRVLA